MKVKSHKFLSLTLVDVKLVNTTLKSVTFGGSLFISRLLNFTNQELQNFVADYRCFEINSMRIFLFIFMQHFSLEF